MHWRDSIFFLKYILKIGLAGETEITADFSQAFIAVGQQAFCLLKPAACDESAHINAKLRFKPFGDIGNTAADLCGYILQADGLIGVAADVIHADIDF